MRKSIPTVNQFTAVIKINSGMKDDLIWAETIAQKLIKKLGLKSVRQTYFKFLPIGITIIHILSQSHLALHFWPEFSLIHIDLVSCKPLNKSLFKRSLEKIFESYNISKLSIKQVNILNNFIS